MKRGEQRGRRNADDRESDEAQRAAESDETQKAKATKRREKASSEMLENFLYLVILLRLDVQTRGSCKVK